jgi:1D-myo-inositol 3-kinase
VAAEADPEFVVIGHVTRDLHADGSTSIGGTATFAALAAQRLGVRAGIVTCAAPDLLVELPKVLAGVTVAARPSAASTVFENIYQGGHRRQYLRARADSIAGDQVPFVWQAARIVLLGPVAQELNPMVASCFPASLVGATPQGWLRRWDSAGLVTPVVWEQAAVALPLLRALVLSREDLAWYDEAMGGEPASDQMGTGTLEQWRRLVPILVLTDGPNGATVYDDGGVRHFPAFRAVERDPTGAGDVFAAAFLIHLARSGNVAAAATFANCMASFVVERPGITGIPDAAQVKRRLHGHAHRTVFCKP